MHIPRTNIVFLSATSLPRKPNSQTAGTSSDCVKAPLRWRDWCCAPHREIQGPRSALWLELVLAPSLHRDLAGIVCYLSLLCRLKSVPWACWQLPKALHSKFGTACLHLQLWSLLLCYLVVQAGDENSFISLSVPFIQNCFYPQSIWKTHPLHTEVVNLSVWRLSWSQWRLLLSSCSRAKWLLLACVHICNHLIQFLQTVAVIC